MAASIHLRRLTAAVAAMLVGDGQCHVDRKHCARRRTRRLVGALYAFKGSSISEQWRSWITRACLAAAIGFGIGTVALGLPGAMFLGVVAASRKLPADSAWPLAILITQVGAFLIVPSSLALRVVIPHAVGWRHVWSDGIPERCRNIPVHDGRDTRSCAALSVRFRVRTAGEGACHSTITSRVRNTDAGCLVSTSEVP